MKSHWHSWTEKIPYTLSKYRVGMEVKAPWYVSVQTYLHMPFVIRYYYG